VTKDLTMQLSASTVTALVAILVLINGPSQTDAAPCASAKTFSDVVAVVNLALKQKHTEVCFNPFHVVKPTGITLVLNGPISLICMQKTSNDKCVIEGGGNHLNIAGGGAKVDVLGFTFIGATQSAIRVLATAPNHHSIVHCNFVKYVLQPNVCYLCPSCTSPNNSSLIQQSRVHDKWPRRRYQN
jgi:hypothetical protein